MRYKRGRSKISNNHQILLSALFALLLLIIFSSAGSAQTKMGDVNGDGRIDVRDVVLVKKHVLKKIALMEQQKIMADVNGDGDIDARDVTLIMQHSIGKISSFPLQVTKVDEVTKTVSLGTSQANIGLPSTVKTTISEGAKRDINVDWGAISTPDYNPNVSGTYVFMGNLVNLPTGITNPGAIKAKATVFVTTPEPSPQTLQSVSINPTSPVVGGTLTAVVAPVGATATYQWTIADSAGGTYSNIAGATSSSYTPVVANVGKFLKVTAIGTGGYTGSVTSVAAGPVLADSIWPVEMEGPPSIVQTIFGYEVTVTIKDQYKEQVCVVNILGVTATKMPDNKRWRVYLPGPITINDLVDNIVIERCLLSIASIQGEPGVGNTLSAGALTPAVATATYQWTIADNTGGTYSNISGATSSSYTPVAANVGKFLKVTATGTGDYTGSVTSSAAGPVLASGFVSVVDMTQTRAVRFMMGETRVLVFLKSGKIASSVVTGGNALTYNTIPGYWRTEPDLLGYNVGDSITVTVTTADGTQVVVLTVQEPL